MRRGNRGPGAKAAAGFLKPSTSGKARNSNFSLAPSLPGRCAPATVVGLGRGEVE